jgi:hypothetical protein
MLNAMSSLSDRSVVGVVPIVSIMFMLCSTYHRGQARQLNHNELHQQLIQ